MPVLSVRVLPRRGVALRAATATVEVTAVLALGHLWAGGTLPSLPWLAVMASLVFGAGLLVLHERVRVRVAVPALVATQLLLHAWLTALTAGAPDHLGHVMVDGGAAHGVLDPSMLVVHVGGALLTALLWHVRARAVDVVVTWSRPLLPPLPLARRIPAPVAVPASLLSRFVVAGAPRRGPPLPTVQPATA